MQGSLYATAIDTVLRVAQQEAAGLAIPIGGIIGICLGILLLLLLCALLALLAVWRSRRDKQVSRPEQGEVVKELVAAPPPGKEDDRSSTSASSASTYDAQYEGSGQREHELEIKVGGVQYSTVQYSTVQYSTVQYSTVQLATSSACWRVKVRWPWSVL